MSRVHLSVGLTRRDDTTHYYPMIDGWRPGAKAHRFNMSVDLPTVDDPEAIAEAVFVATNAPASVVETDPIAKPVYDELERRIAKAQHPDTAAPWPLASDRTLRDHLRSLSVGDTVTISLNGWDSRTYAVAKMGWDDVTEQLVRA